MACQRSKFGTRLSYPDGVTGTGKSADAVRSLIADRRRSRFGQPEDVTVKGRTGSQRILEVLGPS